MDTLKPTPRNTILGFLADIAKESYSPQRTQQMQGVARFMGAPDIASTLDRLSYGESLTSGRGMTTKLKPETEGALTSLLDYIPTSKPALAGAGLLGALGMTKSKAMDALRRPPQAEALETARKNAVKMLGLPENNTAMDRARAMGYVDAYHGTASDIHKIDPTRFGSSTGAKSAKDAFWAVSEPSTARGYAEYAATDAKVKSLLDAADKAEKRGNWDLYDKLVAESEDLAATFQAQPLQGQNVMPLMVRANRGVKGAQMDAAGAEFVDLEGGVNRFLTQARRDGRDLAVIKNLADDVGVNGRPATHYAVMNPSIVRSRFAAFDPARVNDNDLLGRADLGLLGLLAGGSAGAAYLSQDKEK